MKKLLFILAIVFAVVSVNAQSYTGKIDFGSSYVKKTIGTSGFTLTNSDTVDVVITVNQNDEFTFDATMKMDSVSGNPTGTLYVLGRKDSELAWTAIANTAWSTNDETVIVSHTTAVRYREILLRFINGGTGVSKALNYSLKTW